MPNTALELRDGEMTFYAVCPEGMDATQCYNWLRSDPAAQWYLDIPAGYSIVACESGQTTPSITTRACSMGINQAYQDVSFTCTPTDGYILVVIGANGASGFYQYRLLTEAGTVQRDWTPETGDTQALFKVPHGTYTIQVRDSRNIGCSAQLSGIVVSYANCPQPTTQPVSTAPPTTTGDSTTVPTTSGGCSITLGSGTYKVGTNEIYEFPISYTNTSSFSYKLYVVDGSQIGSSNSVLISGGKVQLSMAGFADGNYRLEVYGGSNLCSATSTFYHTSHSLTTATPTTAPSTTPAPTTQRSCTSMAVSVFYQTNTPTIYGVQVSSPDGAVGPFLWQVWSADALTMYSSITTPVSPDSNNLFAINVGSAPSGTSLALRIWSASINCYVSYPFAHVIPTTASPTTTVCRPAGLTTYKFIFGFQPVGTSIGAIFQDVNSACTNYRYYQNQNPPQVDFLYSIGQMGATPTIGDTIYYQVGTNCQKLGAGYYYLLTENGTDTGKVITVDANGIITGITTCALPTTTQAPVTTQPTTTDPNTIPPQSVGAAALNIVKPASADCYIVLTTPGLANTGQSAHSSTNAALRFMGGTTVTNALAFGSRGYKNVSSGIGFYSFAFNVNLLRTAYPSVGELNFDVYVDPDGTVTQYVNRINYSYIASSGIITKTETVNSVNPSGDGIDYDYAENTKAVGGIWDYNSGQAGTRNVNYTSQQRTCLQSTFTLPNGDAKKIGIVNLNLGTGICTFTPVFYGTSCASVSPY